MADETAMDKDSSFETKENESEDSPIHTTGKEQTLDASENERNAPPSDRDWKVWTEDETKLLIRLFKSYNLQYPESSRRFLWEEVSKTLKEYGFTKEPEQIRNRLKTLRTTYRRVQQHNMKHVNKKEYAYMDELTDLYNDSPMLSDDNSSGSGLVFMDDDIDIETNNSYTIADDGDVSRKLRFVRTKPFKPEFSPPIKIKKTVKSNVARKSFTPMFQCGLCLDKFSSSHEMHSHPCPGVKNETKVEKVVNVSSAKKKAPQQQNGKVAFQWNSMSTLQFLIFLKDCKMKPKNSNVHRNLLEAICGLMKKHGISISPFDLEKKWKCLASNYEKTVTYNKKHKDKKKCAFFNRLTDLYKLGATLDMFRVEEPVKMTVEVSPFSYSSSESKKTNGKASASHRAANADKERNGIPNNNNNNNNSTELVQWLNAFWREWKEIERQRRNAEAQRHMELMEILSYVADGFSSRE